MPVFLLLMLGVVASFAVPYAQDRGDDDRRRLIGTWRLVSVEATAAGAVSFPLGRRPSGVLVLGSSGDWAAQLMSETHARSTGDPRVTYRAHFGTFTVDPAKGLLVLRRNGDLDRAGIGSDTLRYYTFEGRRVVFRLPPEQREGVDVVTRITWERVD